WQTKTQGMTLRSNQAVSITSQGAQITKVSDGSYLVQAPNDITITGTGKGDLLFSNGTGGFKIDGNGNIKLFGKQITLKGQSGVTFDGNVEYELGESNAPESADAIEPVEIDEVEALELEGFSAEDNYWFEVELVDSKGQPMVDADYEITTSTGEVHAGKTDSYGVARVEGLTSMEDCTVKFPNLDRPVR
uniref:hypothetical protein n=1 Tax=Agarivorans sp. TaxID=1872412 RepID=UPI003D0210EF